MPPRAAGYLVHCFTASGAAAGFAALLAATAGQFSAMYAWLGVALAIDAADGALARRYQVEKTTPHIDGVILDLVVDFLTYVVVPLVALWRSGLLEPPLAVLVCCAVCAASALYFADRRIKTHDLWFRGFPAIWNVLIFYILVLQPGPLVCTLVIIVFACFMFAPVPFVHPMRVVRFRLLTITLTFMWCAAAIAAMIQGLPEAGFLSKTVLNVVGLYYIFLPFFRNFPKMR
ncbi:MAG TPA: phosphatidylcholine synthase [Methylocella sp.]|jgi:phosphatidylcholine synthase